MEKFKFDIDGNNIHQAYSERSISKQTTRSIFLNYIRGIQSEQYAEEVQRIKQLDRRLNRESLTTDTSGKRTRLWFNRTGKSFSTGEASVCLATALVQPHIGMSASHMNPLTPILVADHMMNGWKI